MDFKVATDLVQIHIHTLAMSVNWDLNSILSLYWKSAENMFNMQIIICTLFEAKSLAVFYLKKGTSTYSFHLFLQYALK